MASLKLAVSLAFLTALGGSLYAQSDGSPTGTEKSSIKFIQADKTEVTIEARVVNWKLTGRVRPKGQMSFPSVDSPVVSHLASMVVPFSMNDVPGGNVYIVRLKPDKKTGLAWGTDAVAQNVPLKDYIVLETAKLQALKVEGGTLITFKTDWELNSGQYSVTIVNNKYAWPFVVR